MVRAAGVTVRLATDLARSGVVYADQFEFGLDLALDGIEHSRQSSDGTRGPDDAVEPRSKPGRRACYVVRN